MRGTTPTHTFTLPVSADNIKTIKITYAQDSNVILEKKTEDVKLEGTTVSVTLTQKETLAFSSESNVEIQVRLLTTSDEALASNISRVLPGILLDDEVLV